jgi:hypothetical protein
MKPTPQRFTDVRGVKPLLAALSSIKAARPSEWSLRAAALGERLEQLCASGEVLATASEEIVAIANREGCVSLIGASPLGERLAGAAVAVAQNGLRIWDGKSTKRNVLVVDGLLVTGSQVSEAIQKLRSAGVGRAMAAVLMAAPSYDVESHKTNHIFVVTAASI